MIDPKTKEAWQWGTHAFEGDISKTLADAYVQAEARARMWKARANIPQPGHLGTRTPETGCDGICMDRASVLNKTLVDYIAEVRAELEKP